MKFTKLSLAALVAMGIATSASAVENVKVDGQIKLWYQTMETDAAGAPDLFHKDSATGDLVAKLRATGDLTKNVGAGVTMYAVTTLGLENNLVSGEAIGITSSDYNTRTTGLNGSTNPYSSILNGSDKLPVWLGEAYMTYKAGKTIVKIGRQELDTPLAFTETWNAAPNTFEAAVLINQDIPNTTLIGAYVSRGNGYVNNLSVNRATVANGSFYNYHANLTTTPTTISGAVQQAIAADDSGGAYAAAAIFSGIPNANLAAFYYDVVDTAQAYWLEGSYNIAGIAKIEALYANLDLSGATEKALSALAEQTTDAFAVQLSGEFSGVKLSGSYSSVSEGFLPVGNTATGFKKTKLYTASVLSDGEIAAKPDTDSWKIAASTKLAGFNLAASYGSYSVGKNKGQNDWFGARNAEFDPSEIDLSVGTKIGDIDVVAHYFNQSEFNAAKQDRQAVRVIASINF